MRKRWHFAMKKKEIFLTSEGYLELENELHYLNSEQKRKRRDKNKRNQIQNY